MPDPTADQKMNRSMVGTIFTQPAPQSFLNPLCPKSEYLGEELIFKPSLCL